MLQYLAAASHKSQRVYGALTKEDNSDVPIEKLILQVKLILVMIVAVLLVLLVTLICYHCTFTSLSQLQMLQTENVLNCRKRHYLLCCCFVIVSGKSSDGSMW